MAIATTDSQVTVLSNGMPGQVINFPYPFYVPSDLKVLTRTTAGVETTLVLGTDYTVAQSPNLTGGTVTIINTIPITITITVVRDLPETQLVSFSTGDRLPASTLERALDKLTMLVQEVGRNVSKALRFSDVGVASAPIVPVNNGVLVTNSTQQMQMVNSIPATGAAPYFLQTDTNGSAPYFAPMPQITASRIAGGAVSNSKILAGTIQPDRMAPNAVAGSYVLGSSGGSVAWVTPSTASVADDSISTAKLQNQAVTGAKIISSATDDTLRPITRDYIKNQEVTQEKLASSLTVDANRAVNTNNIWDNAITSGKLRSSTLVDTDRAVTTDHIRDQAVTNAKLASSLTTDANRAVNTNNIWDNSVNWRKRDSGCHIQSTERVINTFSSLVNTTAGVPMPYTTVPTWQDGVLLMTRLIDPKATTNRLQVSVDLMLSVSLPSSIVVGLYYQPTPTVSPTGITLTATSAATTYTFTSSAPHGLTTGQRITVTGMSVAGYNISGAVTVPTGSTNTFTMVGTVSAPAAGSGGAFTIDPVFIRGSYYTIGGANWISSVNFTEYVSNLPNTNSVRFHVRVGTAAGSAMTMYVNGINTGTLFGTNSGLCKSTMCVTEVKA